MLDIVMKLNGPVKAVGETNTDKQRMENLKNLINLAHDIHAIIDDVYCDASHCHQKSIKEIGNVAQEFLSKTLNSKHSKL